METNNTCHMLGHSPGLVLAWVGTLVDVIHQPGKGAGVQRLGHGMPVLLGLSVFEGNKSDVSPNVDLPLQQTAK